MFARYVFNVKMEGEKMNERKRMFKWLTIGLGISACWAALGHVLKPWAVQWLIAGCYVMGLFIIWAMTGPSNTADDDEEQKLI